MQVFKRGAKHDHGRTTLCDAPFKATGSFPNNTSASIQWFLESDAVNFVVHDVRDSERETSHNYVVQLSSEDIAEFIEQLGKACLDQDATGLRSELSNHIPAIIKILAAASGLTDHSIET